MSVAVADEPGVEVVSVQQDVAKPAPVAVYGISGGSFWSSTVLPSSAALVKVLASRPKYCTALVGCFVSGVSTPMSRTV